jgi:hypothetical protein
MKNREIIMRRLEKTEGLVAKMEFALRRGASREDFDVLIYELKDAISDTKAFIQQEPLSPGEINSY